MNLMNLMNLKFSVLCIALVAAACSNYPDPAPYLVEPAPQTVQSSEKPENPELSARKEVDRLPKVPNLILEAAGKHYQTALHETLEGRFDRGLELWTQYINIYPGTIRFNHARYYHGFCLVRLKRGKEATESLKSVVQSAHPGEEDGILIESALLLLDVLAENRQYDETLALTFDLVPDIKSERRMGLLRGKVPPPLNLSQEIRLHLMRAKALAALGRDTEANRSLRIAKRNLRKSTLQELTQEEALKLNAELQLREIETLAMTCEKQIRPASKMSEKEFIAYADAHYGCAAAARRLMCDLWAARNPEVNPHGARFFQDALPTYKAMVELPLRLRDPLPPPSRTLKPKQKAFYEQDMKSLIDRTVDANAKVFKTIEQCKATDLF